MPAKKGNKNALKHGIYARFISVTDDTAIQKMSLTTITAEIAYARVRLKEASQERDKATDPDYRLKWDFACRHWIEIITNAIIRSVAKGEVQAAVWTTLFEAVRAANDKQGIVP